MLLLFTSFQDERFPQHLPKVTKEVLHLLFNIYCIDQKTMSQPKVTKGTLLHLHSGNVCTQRVTLAPTYS